MHTLVRMMTPDLPSYYVASNVHPYLWIGPCPPIDHELAGFSAVVLCASEYQPPALSFLGHIWRVRLEDWEVPLSPSHARDVARAGRAIAKQVSQGNHVLVTCFAGLNRSGLVLGTALIELGFDADEAIRLIRTNHSELALNNRVFCSHLQFYGKGLAHRA